MKYLTTILFAMLATFALGQGDKPPIYWATVTFATELDGEMVECPMELAAPHYCFMYDFSQDLLKIEFTSLVDSFSDLQWAGAWGRSDTVLSRMLLKSSEPRAMYGVYTVPYGGTGTMVFIADLPVD